MLQPLYKRKKNKSVSDINHLFTRDSATGAANAAKYPYYDLSNSKRNCAQALPPTLN